MMHDRPSTMHHIHGRSLKPNTRNPEPPRRYKVSICTRAPKRKQLHHRTCFEYRIDSRFQPVKESMKAQPATPCLIPLYPPHRAPTSVDYLFPHESCTRCIAPPIHRISKSNLIPDLACGMWLADPDTWCIPSQIWPRH